MRAYKVLMSDDSESLKRMISDYQLKGWKLQGKTEVSYKTGIKPREYLQTIYIDRPSSNDNITL